MSSELDVGTSMSSGLRHDTVPTVCHDEMVVKYITKLFDFKYCRKPEFERLVYFSIKCINIINVQCNLCSFYKVSITQFIERCLKRALNKLSL